MSLDLHTLTGRRPPREVPSLPLGPGVALRLARLHECCGNARQSFAVMTAARAGPSPERPLIWIAPEWQAGRLHGEGLAPLLEPRCIIFVTPKRAEDILWTLEEVLRAGVAPLAVADLPGLPTLTAVRRLHLAAETGAAEGALSPTGLILTPGDGGAPGVESRWRMSGDHPAERAEEMPGAGRWRLDLLRARAAPPASWRVEKPRRGGFEIRPPLPAPVA